MIKERLFHEASVDRGEFQGILGIHSDILGFFKDIIVTTMGISLKGRIPKHPQLPMQLVVESIHVHDQ